MLGHTLTLGLSQGACRFVPGDQAQGDLDLARGYIRAGALVTGGAALAVAGLGAALLALEPDLFAPAYRAPIAVAVCVMPLFALQDYLEGRRAQPELGRARDRAALPPPSDPDDGLHGRGGPVRGAAAGRGRDGLHAGRRRRRDRAAGRPARRAARPGAAPRAAPLPVARLARHQPADRRDRSRQCRLHLRRRDRPRRPGEPGRGRDLFRGDADPAIRRVRAFRRQRRDAPALQRGPGAGQPLPAGRAGPPPGPDDGGRDRRGRRRDPRREPAAPGDVRSRARRERADPVRPRGRQRRWRACSGRAKTC